jgi:colicin import membrane protein
VPRGVSAVDLVALEAPRPAAPPAPAPPKAAAPPEPARPLPPKAPVKEKIVLPKEAAMPKAKPKPKPAPPVRRELTPEDLEKTTQHDYSDVMAQLRSEVPEDLPPVEESEPAPAGAAAPAGAPSGTAAPIPPEEAAWIKRAKIHVRQNWTLTAGFRTQALETHVLVDLDAAGNILGDPEIVRRSGNPWYDDSVVRALAKSSPLPPPPAAGEWAFVFIPEDSF